MAARARVVWGILGACIAALTVAVYLPALDVPFVYDDLAEIVENRDLHDLAQPGRIVGYNPARALLMLLFATEWHFFGDDPLPFHITSILVHLVCGGLLAALCLRVLRGRGAPRPATATEGTVTLVTVALFLVHPLFVETVTYIASRSSSLCALFYVATVLAWSRMRDAQAGGRRAWPWFLAAFVGAGLAITTKEEAGTLAGALLLFDLCLAPPLTMRQHLAPHAPVWLTMGTLIGLRLYLFGTSSEGPWVRTIPENLWTEAGVVVGYLSRLFVPTPLSIYHDVRTVTAPVPASAVAAAGLHLSLIGLGLWWMRRGSPFTSTLAFPLLWWYLTLLPTSSFIPLKEAMAEHRTYLPSLGAFTGLALALTSLQRPRVRAGAQLAVLTVAAVFAGLTLRYNRLWTDEVALWRNATTIAPHSGDAFYALGDTYRRRGLLDEAIAAYTHAIESYEARGIPTKSSDGTAIVYNYPDAMNNLGLCFALKGDLDRAITQFRQAARAFPSLGARAYTNLGYALTVKGQYQSAEEALLRAVEADGTSFLAHLHLANLYFAYLPDRAKALDHYRAVLAIDPQASGREAVEARIVELSY